MARARPALRAGRVLRTPVVLDVVVPFIASRVALTIVGLLALQLLFPWGTLVARPGGPDWISTWARWDSGYYLAIARESYRYTGDIGSTVGFWPLLPGLMRAGGWILGWTDNHGLLRVGLIVSNAALLVGLVYLRALVRLDFGRATAARAVLYALAFPMTLFLSAVYAESLFLALSVAAFYHARRNQWWVAGALGGLAALARPHGVLLAAPLAVEYLLQRRSELAGARADPRVLLRAFRPDVLALLLIPAGLAVYLGYLWLEFGDPLIGFKAHHFWGQRLTPPWTTFERFFSAPVGVREGFQRHSLIDLCFALVYIVLVIASWRVVRPTYAMFATIGLVTALSSGLLTSIPRYGVTLFPIFIVLAVAGRRRWFDRAFLLAAAPLAGFFMALFSSRHWVA